MPIFIKVIHVCPTEQHKRVKIETQKPLSRNHCQPLKPLSRENNKHQKQKKENNKVQYLPSDPSSAVGTGRSGKLAIYCAPTGHGGPVAPETPIDPNAP